jgi:signal transduction histidine kinase/CheY-like chemotaxis protein
MGTKRVTPTSSSEDEVVGVLSGSEIFGLDELVSEKARRVASGGRIRASLMIFIALLLVSLTGLTLLLVSSIFDRLTPSIRSDLEWKAQQGASALSKSMEVGIAARDEKIVADLAKPYLENSDVAAIVVLGADGSPLYQQGDLGFSQDELFEGAPSRIHEHDRVIWSWFPSSIEAVTVGKVALVVSLERMQAGVLLKRNILILSAAGSLTGLVLSLLFYQFWIGPLLRLVASTFRKLEKATSMALESTRLKSEFIANMSHEIRTPMNGVIGMTELLQETSLDVRQRRFANTISASANALLTVINDILDFSKIEAAKLEIKSFEFCPRDLVEDLAVLMSERAHAKDLEIATYIQPGIPEQVVGDADRLRQVLANLMANAVKFTEIGEVVVRVTVSSTAKKRAVLRFEVIDTGIGISPEDARRLFKAFSQIDGSLTRKHGGTGLGLVISRRLVELMGGRLEVESEPGRGSKFWFDLPFDLTDEARQPTVFNAADEHVLIVDDNATNRVILEELLGGWHVRHASAAGGHQALSMLDEYHQNGNPITTIILDMQMPGMSGLDVARELRNDDRFSELHILMLTSLGTDAARAEGLPQWVEQVLVKPVKQADLAAALPGLRLERRYAASTAPKPHVAPEKDARGFRILLVEDHPLNQEVMKDMLGSLGYRFDLAENGERALEELQARQYSLVLMDCQMPVLDGYEATRRWRRFETEEGRDRTPIVAVTAHALADEREKVLRAGMDDFLTKPVKVDSLREVMSSWLRGAKRFSLPPGSPAASIPPPPVASATPASSQEGRALLDTKTPRSPRMYELFLDSTQDDLDFLQEALAVEDAESLRVCAHRLKGSSYTFGAEQLGDKAAELEQMAKASNLNAEQQLQDLIEIFSRTVQVVAQERGQGGNASS